METQRQEFRIGIMVLACLVSLTLFTVFFGNRTAIRFGSGETTIEVRFQRAPGIKRSTPVLKNGIQIGRVTRVELVDNDQMVAVSISLDKRRKIYTDEECRIRQTVITGDTSLEFAKRPNYVGKVEQITTDSVPYLVGISSSDLLSGFGNIEGDLTKVVHSVADAAEQIGGFMERLNNAIGSPEDFGVYQEKFSAVVEETRQTMASVRQTTDGINHIVGDPDIQVNIRKVINELPDILDRARVLVGESTLFVRESRGLIEKGSESLDNLTIGLERVSRTLEVITKIADQVEGDVPEIVSAVKRSALQLESLFSELTTIIQNFRNADGTVKRLIRDPEAYEKILATLDNVEKITDEVDWMIRTDFKPVAHNVKVLTDKAARDPAIFIRNLLRKEPPIKMLPCSFGRHTCEVASYFPTTVIDGEVVEVLEEIPVQVSRVPKLQRRTMMPSYGEQVLPQSSEGRIVNVDPRYSDF
ncbi:MAG: MlaD family protein [Planctomycetaceae bacterium]|jgi:phospholipid/cholesterol/gamma-HCH transport system substrate-binding protein|nr:MlaD family protein [Planctomycetaceae bacterium]